MDIVTGDAGNRQQLQRQEFAAACGHAAFVKGNPVSNGMLHSTILRRLATVKNETVAAAIDCDASHVSRIASGERGVRIAQIEAFLASIGLRAVESGGDMVVMSGEEARALQVLARKGLRFDNL